MAIEHIILFLNELNTCWKTKKAKKLSEFFSLRSAHVRDPNFHSQIPASEITSNVDPPVNVLIQAHFSCILAMSNKDYLEAYDHQYMVTQNIIKNFQNQKFQNWFFPVVYTVCIDIRLLAGKVQTYYRSLNSSLHNLNVKEIWEKTADVIMNVFRICAADNRGSYGETKKWGMMQIANQLFKIYFKITKLHLMKPLNKAIQSCPIRNEFSILQQVTYRYYLGCKAAYDGEYIKAAEYLTFSFNKCPKHSTKNRKLILNFLVPVKILLGYMPGKGLLNKHDLIALQEISDAVKLGDIKRMEEIMSEHRHFFMVTGIYLIVEKLKLIAYRNLFKKVYLIHKNHVLDLNILAAARKMDNPDFSLDETECILSNLIFHSKIKGYISSAHQKLVLSKIDPFPKLSTLN